MEDVVLFVEGKTDRRAIHQIAPHLSIVCTYGTMSQYDVEQLIEPYEQCALYTFFDRDATGDRLRAQWNATCFHVTHLHVPPPTIEVAELSREQLRSICHMHHLL